METAMGTCREPLANVGLDVFNSPFNFKRSESEKPWRTSRAFARKPPFLSEAHFKTNLARKMRLGSALWGSVSTSQTPFSKILASSDFLPSKNAKRSSTFIFCSLRSAGSFTCFFLGTEIDHVGLLIVHIDLSLTLNHSEAIDILQACGIHCKTLELWKSKFCQGHDFSPRNHLHSSRSLVCHPTKTRWTCHHSTILQATSLWASPRQTNEDQHQTWDLHQVSASCHDAVELGEVHLQEVLVWTLEAFLSTTSPVGQLVGVFLENFHLVQACRLGQPQHQVRLLSERFARFQSFAVEDLVLENSLVLQAHADRRLQEVGEVVPDVAHSPQERPWIQGCLWL